MARSSNNFYIFLSQFIYLQQTNLNLALISPTPTPTPTPSHIINYVFHFYFLRFLLEIEGKSKFAEQTYTIATNAGKIIPKTTKDGSITVDMGSPILQPDKIPTSLAATKNNAVVEGVINACGVDYKVNCVSMGNPHAVHELFILIY